MRTLRGLRPRSSYGQFGEDAVLQAFLPDEIGFYIDIGSGHPIVGSNTYALYNLGWRGILVDAVESNIKISRLIRTRDTSIHAAVGDGLTSSINFIEFEVYQYSTTSESRAAEISALGHKIRARYEVPNIKLSDFQHQIPLGVPLVLNLDVEGQEMDVLESNDWDAFRPDYIMVEELQPPWSYNSATKIYLEQLEYELFALAGVTCIYRYKIR